jgi:predicted RNase H-like HicB family nuclease
VIYIRRSGSFADRIGERFCAITSGDETMQTFTYAAEFEPGDKRGVVVVSFPDVPEAITQGDNPADARAQAEEALGLALLTYPERGLPLPKSRAKGNGLTMVAVAAGRCSEARRAGSLGGGRHRKEQTRPSHGKRRERDSSHSGSEAPDEIAGNGRSVTGAG